MLGVAWRRTLRLKVATERRRRRCAFGSKLRHVCWRGGASRPPGAIRVGYRLALASRRCCHGAWRGSHRLDAEATRSERRGSESRLRVRALSSRAVFAITAVALPLPTMTTAGSGVAIGSPAISRCWWQPIRARAGPRAQGGDGAPTAAMRFRIKAAAWVLERGRLPSTGCDPGRLSTRSCVTALLSRCFPGVRLDGHSRGTLAHGRLRSARERRAPIGMRVLFARHTLHPPPPDQAAASTRPGKLTLRPAAKLPFSVR